uniref:Secreted protein n=1 Tax=Ascaris lumbricoides TaxID=6252 RepID=A0A0M3HQY9_ASCLU
MQRALSACCFGFLLFYLFIVENKAMRLKRGEGSGEEVIHAEKVVNIFAVESNDGVNATDDGSGLLSELSEGAQDPVVALLA